MFRALVVAALSVGCSRGVIGPDSEPRPAAPPPSAAAPAPPPTAPNQRPTSVTQADEDDVREATFRHMFQKNASGQQQRARVYCLHVERGADPSPAFLARFANVKARVRAGSDCSETGAGVFEHATNDSGLAFRIDQIVWTDRDHATVSGGYFEAGLSASGNLYTLERKTGGWVVTADVMQWIS